MGDISNSNTPLIRDLYDTAEQALEVSIKLGCGGYRTYNINGQTKYVPCSSYLDYETALKFNKEQGKITASGNDVFGGKLVGYQFANSKDEIQGDPFFTLGNFNINKSVSKPTQNNNISFPDQPNSFTAQDIGQLASINNVSGAELINQINQTVQSNLQVSINFDKNKLENYVLYSSLKERLKNTIIEIAQTYPAGIKILPISTLVPSISNYNNMVVDDRAQFKVNLSNIFNPFQIEYTVTGVTKNDDVNLTPLRNFSKTFKDFVIFYNDVEYPIIDITLPKTTNDQETGIVITTDGRPFLDIINRNGDGSVNFYIKPSAFKFKEFYNNLSELGSFLLNFNKEIKKFKSEFKRPIYSDDGKLTLVKQTIYFPLYDNVNVDLFSNDFDNFISNLNTIADDYDLYKTNLISRFLTTDSLKEFDTPDKKIGILFQLYGKMFDETIQFIDGISFMRNVSYDKIENVPDLLLKNFANMLGWDTFEIQDDQTIIQSLFDLKNEKADKNGLTPAELDIEFWRRLVINSFYLFKSKGTRKSIEFILKLIGVPEYLLELNEYVYVADHKIDPIATLNKIFNNSNITDPSLLLGQYPFTGDGYPDVPPNIPFQANGGYLRINDKNVGPYDFGKKYIDTFKNFDGFTGFELTRTVDNQKSWAYTEIPHYRINDNDLRVTNYFENDSRLLINSKELELYITSDKIVDFTVYNYFVKNNVNISTQLDVIYTNTIQPKTLTFHQYMVDVVNDYINVSNRKTIKTYPTLSKIYFDFLRLSGEYVNNTKALSFLGLFDTFWVKFVEQFIPGTTIVNAGNKIKNSVYLDNKFIYKHGLNNDVNWLGTDGSEFQNKALKPVYIGTSQSNTNIGVIKKSIFGKPITFNIKGINGEHLIGSDNTINQFSGSYFSIIDSCNSVGEFELWKADTDYTLSIYGGNIEETAVNQNNSVLYNNNTALLRRYGVFVIYNGNLYRLNTIRGKITTFAGATGVTVTTTSITNFPQTPNIAVWILNNITYTDYCYELINKNVDSKTITFRDCNGTTSPLPNHTEREFFINSIGLAFNYLNAGYSFDCPPPQPHVCYFDFTGRTINLINNGLDSSNINYSLPSVAKYIDNTGIERTIKQPKYYGYSKNIVYTSPIDAILGYHNNWGVPYQTKRLWNTGDVYYKNELLYQTGDTNTYVVINNSITGSSTNLLSLIGSGITLSEVKGSLYEKYSDRIHTDPLMQIDSAFITYLKIDPLKDIESINLTKSINLDYVFSGSTSDTTFNVKDNIIEDKLYFSDNLSISFEGLYPVNKDNIGPFYIPKTDESLVQTLDESLVLTPGKDNYVSIESLNNNFNTISTNIALNGSSPGYYIITNSAYFRFVFTLYFESTLTDPQSVIIKLLDTNGLIYEQQNFIFSGADLVANRMFVFDHKGFFKVNSKVYLAIEPVDHECTLSRYEKIDYTYIEPSLGDYDPSDDARFRLMFNSGRRINKGLEYEQVLSISPIFGKKDSTITSPTTSSTSSFYNVDEYLLITNLNNGLENLNIPKLTLNQPRDTELMFNKIYSEYFEKNRNNSALAETDKALLDKKINFDKIDFSFKIRSKKLPSIPSSINADLNNITQNSVTSGIFGLVKEVTLNFSDYFLGNTNKFYEGGSVSKNIIIGKNITNRTLEVDKLFSFIPNASFKNSTTLISNSTGSTLDYQIFKAYNSGILDTINFNLNVDSSLEILNTRRAIISNKRYGLDNPVYSSEIYQKFLNNVEYFNEKIINYNINDIVKFTISSYKQVISSPTGYTTQTINVDRLYVCVEEITLQHCLRTTGSTPTPTKIANIYQPNGNNSCFVEITKYDPKNFTPWGYEKLPYYGVNFNNIEDYTYKKIVNYTESSESLNLVFGDIVKYNNKIFKFIYQKPITYYSGTTINGIDYSNNVVYYHGNFVNYADSNNPNYKFYAVKDTNINGVKTLPTTTPTWTGLTTGGTHDPFNSSSLFPDETLGSWLSGKIVHHTKAKKMPNLVPSDNKGNPVGWTITSSITAPNQMLVSDIYTDAALIGEISEDQYNVVGYYSFNDGSISLPYTGYTGAINNYTAETNLYRYNIKSAYSGNLNIYLLWNLVFGIHPLFEELCDANKINNPMDFNAGIRYDRSSLYHVYKYAVSRGKLYKYISNIPGTTSVLPFLDSQNWGNTDFCLSENFTVYKDRTKVTIYESDVISLTDSVKDSFYAYNSDFSLKPGFVNRSFSGSTIDNKLITGIEKYIDSKNANKGNTFKYGNFAVRQQNSNIILDYTIDKDDNALPRTGEFFGKLNITDPCGNSATTIFNLLLDTDVTQLSSLHPSSSQAIITQPDTFTLPYNIRLIVNQAGFAVVNISWNSSDSLVSGQKTLDKTSVFDNIINISPNTSFTVTFKYDTNRKQTTFDYAFLNGISFFSNNIPLNNSSVVVTKNDVGTIETITITLNNVTQNNTITFGVKGITSTLASETNTNNAINLR